ncbi:hypothetical protein B0H14DRAFT_611255 [Mycena olivaceomarginata]|nr:hypothetical protein B0H14DRAFT_611255 [Mycena olivaceomarginata]
MPSQHRRRSHKDPDDERIHERIPQRVEESHSDPYSRLPNDFRQTTNYRRTDSTSSHSGRGSYDMSRASSSRNHRDSNWRPKDAERSYTDEYYRERRDDVAAAREPESWPARTVPEPRFSEREWSQAQRYDAGYSTSSYPKESSSWGMPSNAHAPLDHRNGHQERWHSQDNRGHAFKGRPPERTQTVEPRVDWQNRSSRANSSTFVEPWNGIAETNPAVDNRSWEPAPTWQPSASGERQPYRNQNGQRNDYYNKHSAGGRRGGGHSRGNHHNASYNNQTHTKPQRDWRTDDESPNNWSRREGSERAPLPSPSSRKHVRSPTRSRSRSRSPAESYYSRRSSRGHTRSPSPASKRRRRDSSPAVVAGRPSHDAGRPSHDAGRPSHDTGHAIWEPRHGQPLPQPSENTHRQSHVTARPRDASRESSRSAGRSPSRSRSPNPESHSFHRLATAVSAPAIVSSPRPAVDNVFRESTTRRNGTVR